MLALRTLQILVVAAALSCALLFYFRPLQLPESDDIAHNFGSGRHKKAGFLNPDGTSLGVSNGLELSTNLQGQDHSTLSGSESAKSPESRASSIGSEPPSPPSLPLRDVPAASREGLPDDWGGPPLQPMCRECCRSRRQYPRDGMLVACQGLLPQKDKECVVYSTSNEDDLDFDIAMAEEGCEVHRLVPQLSARQKSYREKEAFDEGVRMHPVGIGGEDKVYEPGEVPYSWPGPNMASTDKSNKEEWDLRTLLGLLSMMGHTSVSVLRIDTEGSEWPFLRAAVTDPDSRQALRDGAVVQLLLQAHFMPPKGHMLVLSPQHPADVEAKNLEFQGVLEELQKLGFSVIWRETLTNYIVNVAMAWSN
eukprot:TRINITY_DN16354_c0_g1_i1.p1 TRINITY_DN16354_c0_g1~~TRINITY_DN16354_c0_g1_i1.p1  ORF type:complete len:364 (+),score=60.77 TRINITY_DN16354_c0_g1_i1:49-1140(+)